MNSRPRILIVSPRVVSSFVKQDYDLLADRFDVHLLPVHSWRSLPKLYSEMKRADATLIWFLGRHALPATILGRSLNVPIVSIIGGFEVAWVDSLRYGIRPGSYKERVIGWMIAQSHLVVSVSTFSKGEAETRFPQFSQKFRLVPNAVDTSRLSLPITGRREGVISVGAINRETIGRKSWQTFSDVASRTPDIRYSIVGNVGDLAGRKFIQDLPANVTWHGYLSTEQLTRKLQEASVYLQPSVHEAFCVALAEAMSCGCFPVVAELAALPEVTGGTATLLHSLSPDAVEAAIRNALKRPESDRVVIRDRIVANYGTERRGQLLREIISEVMTATASWPH